MADMSLKVITLIRTRTLVILGIIARSITFIYSLDTHTHTHACARMRTRTCARRVGQG